MTYENPQVPHEVNVSRESALREFLRLSAGLLLFVLACSAVLYTGGSRLARFVPFSMEKSWVGDRVVGVELGSHATPGRQRIEAYLQTLVDRMASKMALPPDMKLTAHYAVMSVPNAFATLGGHIVVTSDLYRRMPSENALAMVLGHEIAHVRARDPLAALGGAASVTLLLAVISGDADSLVQSAGSVVLLGYSRRAEERADAAAISALRAVYGHAGGGSAVFEVLSEYTEKADVGEVPSLLSTHPADQDRIARLKAAAADWDPAVQPLQPIAVAAE